MIDILQVKLNRTKLPGYRELRITDIVHNDILVILIGKAPRDMLTAVYHGEDKFQKRTRHTDPDFFHRKAGHIHIQVDNRHRLVESELLHHAGILFYPLYLEQDVDIIGKSIL